MKNFVLLSLYLFSVDAYSQNVSKMDTCQEEVRIKCKGMTFQQCKEKKLLSSNCSEAMAVMKEAKGYIGNNCREILEICKFEKRTKNGPSTTDRVKKFQQCVQEKRHLFSTSCKTFIKDAQKTGGKRDQLNKAIEH